MMTEEDKISLKLKDALCQRKNNFPNIEFEHKQEILIGVTCGFHDSNLRLLFQSAEQDIVICLKNKPEFEGKDFFRKFPKSLVDNKILIPLVIFEVKCEKVNTHTIRQYSELARMIKTIFPFCLYNLLLINIEMPKNRNTDKIYMAGKNFDKIIYKSGYAPDNQIHNELVDIMWKII